ncbi:LOW QUALITY PROTEIN: hypothetical protein PHMEG_00011805 [Phytophthora megakarya]|uniref:SWIM-type domain-containing protein n=1 Tax=Phytophthora megakarya TaxID=4795 RepID=A0A225WAN8_9STRA|nr:LOW QUALITY PROTEIN: hypothetical protein PHMEG_00011805 [Phytophthora megakarya]
MPPKKDWKQLTEIYEESAFVKYRWVYAVVGNGEDDEPLILGITSMKLMQSILNLQRKERFLIFHIDATYKLSDIGYPVITCGFTDRRRVYHVASIYLVSQQTENEYYEAIRSFVRVVFERMHAELRIDAVMGDGDKAQFNVISIFDVFFHVLYNVRKRIQHLADSIRAVVYRGVLDMHYTLGRDQLLSEWNRVSSERIVDRRLNVFTSHFYTQWMILALADISFTWCIRYDKQSFVLRYAKTIRFAYHLIRVVSPKEASLFAKTGQESIVRVRYLGDQFRDRDPTSSLSGLADNGGSANTHLDWTQSAKQLNDEEKVKAAKFYRSAVSWSVRRAHHAGMPHEGWVVHANRFECTCPNFTKFLACAHIICGRVAYGLSMPGVNGYNLKFKDRRIHKPKNGQLPAANGAWPSLQRAQMTLLGQLAAYPR